MRRNMSAAAKIGMVLALALCLLGQRSAPALAAPIFNGGFESGDLSGWTVSAGTDGSVNVTDEYQPDYAQAPYTADGKYFALLSSGEPQVWTSIRQTFDVAAGGSITCNVFYAPAQARRAGDAAEVRVLSGSSVVATLISWTAASAPDPSRVQWTVLPQQPVPQAGQYTLEARIKNGDGSSDPGYLGVDACQAGASRPANPADFTVQADGTDVEIAWQKPASANVTGFNIYRSASAAGNYEKINDVPVAADPAVTEVETFSYLDSPGQGAFYYKLEAIGEGGNQMYGPNSTGATGQASPAGSTPAPPAFRRPGHHPIPPPG